MAPRVAPSIALNVIISLRGRAQRNLPDIVVHTQVCVSFATVVSFARKVAAHAHTPYAHPEHMPPPAAEHAACTRAHEHILTQAGPGARRYASSPQDKKDRMRAPRGCGRWPSP